MKKIALLYALILFLPSTNAAEKCLAPILVGNDLFQLYKTDILEVEKKYGFTEKFSYGETGIEAFCYQGKGSYISFGFAFIENKNRLSSVTISALPPSGYEGSFCKQLSQEFIPSIDNKKVGDEKKGGDESLVLNIDDITFLGSRDNFECSLIENTVYVKGRLIYYVKGLTETN